jgi:hypothetical protein
MIDWKSATNEDALAEWDRGGSVWSCELGGLGPGYEQCIQIMGFEFLRAMLADPFDYSKADDKDQWKAYIDKIEGMPGPKSVIEQLSPSGAQFGAAMNIASVFARNGYSKGMDMVPEDRRIQVSKDFQSIAA